MTVANSFIEAPAYKEIIFDLGNYTIPSKETLSVDITSHVPTNAVVLSASWERNVGTSNVAIMGAPFLDSNNVWRLQFYNYYSGGADIAPRIHLLCRL